MKKNGFGIPELVITFGIFSIIYFIFVFNIAGNFNVDYDKEIFALTISSIEDEAALYGEVKEELFSESDTIYVTVEELALENYIMSDSYGIVKDPRDEAKTLNELKVKIEKKNDKVSAKVLGI